MKKLEDFYKDLYQEKTKQPSNENIFLKNKDIPTLNNEERDICEGELTVNECYRALESFENNKSPGNDGLTAEFYRCFWPLLGKQLVNCLNYSLLTRQTLKFSASSYH